MTLTDIHTYPIDLYPEKQQTRLDTLNLLRDPTRPTSLFYDDHLTRDWAELCGDAPDATCELLLNEDVLTPTSKYIGLNSDPNIIQRNAEAFPEATADGRALWVPGYAEHLMHDLDNPILRNVGVLVFDAFYSPSNMSLDQILGRVLRFSLNQFNRHGQFLLVINQTLRGTKAISLDKGCKQYARIIKEHCHVDLPEDAFKVYQSRVARMRILRLSFGW